MTTLDEARRYAAQHPEATTLPTRAQADAVLDSLDAQIARVRNNDQRRRLQKALGRAKAKRARTLEIERMRAESARTLTSPAPGELLTQEQMAALARGLGRRKVMDRAEIAALYGPRHGKTAMLRAEVEKARAEGRAIHEAKR
jgi:hypothetical protein